MANKDIENRVQALRQGDIVQLGKAITLVESTHPKDEADALALVDQCLPHTGNSIRIGVTGAPGVGKSSFLEALGGELIGRGKKVAVLAIDPSSEKTGGSILGDKTRMANLSRNSNAFVRPSPSTGVLGGVGRKTRESILLCEAAGFDIIFVETVGVGQSEVGVATMVDFFLLLILAGSGDELQGIKRGIMEMADAIVITKTDGENTNRAKQAALEYQAALRLFPPRADHWKPSVFTSSIHDKKSIEEVWALVQSFFEQMKYGPYFEKKRDHQLMHWFKETINANIQSAFYNHPQIKTTFSIVEKEVLSKKISPHSAAEKLLKTYREAN